MKVLITGADGFIGKNLCLHLSSLNEISIIPFTRKNSVHDLSEMLKDADFVCHLAGVNRTDVLDHFTQGNVNITIALCDALSGLNKFIPIIYSSSTQAALSNPYALSKCGAEEVLQAYSERCAAPVYIYRLPNVFGKWAKPNYNSVVATFCHNIARGLPVEIHDPASKISLVYVDDVVAQFINVIKKKPTNLGLFCTLEPIYQITVGELATQLETFSNSRQSLITDAVGSGFIRALYATYVSYLPTELFSYEIPKYGDPRGVFVEMLKTHDAGQFSYFTALPGVTRGGHYHHSKTEKFLVIKGRANFRFRHMISREYYELITTGDHPEIVETVPGWTHDITNIGVDVMIVMLWANEIFDRDNPDTYPCGI